MAQRENSTSFDAYLLGYPINLLAVVKAASDRILSGTLTADRLAGIRYALSTLPEASQMWVRLRFEEGRSSEDTASALGLSQAEETLLQKETLFKLRYTSRWDWIQFGIEGNLKERLTLVQAEGYRQGYQKGLEDGLRGQEPKAVPASLLSMPLPGLPFPARLRNALERTGFTTLGELLTLDEYGIMRIRGLGAHSANLIARFLIENGITGTDWELFLKP